MWKLESELNYTSYMNNIYPHFSHESKLFRNYIKNLKKYNSIPAEMEFNNITKINGPKIADLFKNKI